MTLGSRIRAARKAKGLTQEELAPDCGVTLQMISRYELGKAVPSTGTLSRIAARFGVTVDFLLNGPDEPQPDEGRAA